jgi:hypothetical protein
MHRVQELRSSGVACCVGLLLACLLSMAPARAAAQDREGDAAEKNGNASETRPAPIDLALWSDRETYAVGDVPSYHARSSEDCYLTLINVDPDRSAVVLFPNEFEPDNRLEAGRELKLPKPDSPYRFRLAKAGRETLIGICTQSPRPPPGISHDFGRLRFTMLGDWDTFLAGLANGRAETGASPADASQKRARGRARRQQEEPERQALPDRQVRTEFSYEVR